MHFFLEEEEHEKNLNLEFLDNFSLYQEHQHNTATPLAQQREKRQKIILHQKADSHIFPFFPLSNSLSLQLVEKKSHIHSFEYYSEKKRTEKL